MRIKITFVACLITLLLGFQTAQAQRPGGKGNTSKEDFVVFGVHGTITVATPLNQNLTELQCSDIEVRIEQEKPSQGGLNIPTYEVVASSKATGKISKGKCSYIIPNSFGLPVKTYKVSLTTSKDVPNCNSIDVSAGYKPVTFPTGNKVETIDFDVKKPLCNQIK
ncbi:MAG: hypothetical protein QOC96_2574 [Acidobacteriota bacterium]|jgi:hypothetical protein|nr:hypothetical protein [Acidobacteriota bacterium]